MKQQKENLWSDMDQVGRLVSFSEKHVSLSVDVILHRRFLSHLLCHMIRTKNTVNFVVYRLFSDPLIRS